MVSLQKFQSQMVSEVELELKGRLKLLSLSAQERANIEATLRVEEQRRNLVGKQIGAASKVIQDEGAFKFKMESKNVGETISTDEFNKIKGIIGDTNQLLIQQGGWTDAIAASVRNQVFQSTKRVDVAKAVVELLEEQMGHLEKTNALEALSTAKALFRKTITESTLKTQKRMVANMKAELSIEGELLKNTLEQKKHSLEIAKLEGQQHGKGKGESLRLEKLITDEKLAQAKLERDAELKRIDQGVRSKLFADAETQGLNLEQLGIIKADLKGADTHEEFVKIINKMERFSKDEEKAKIKAITLEKIAAIDRAEKLGLSANYFYDSVVGAGRAFVSAISGFLPPEVKEALGKGAWVAEGIVADAAEKKRREEAKQAAGEAKTRALTEGATAIHGVEFRKAHIKSQLQELEDRKEAGKIAEKDYEIQKQNLENALAAAGDILNTFEKQVLDFVYNLRQAAEDLKFQGFSTTDASGILQNARDKAENRRLQQLAKQGLTPKQFAQQGIAAGAEKRTIKGLEDQAFLSPTAAGARSFTRQIPILEEIFEIKKEINKTGEMTAEQEQKLLELEKKRLQVNETLSAKLEDAFVFTQTEIQNELNTKLVDGAQQFHQGNF